MGQPAASSQRRTKALLGFKDMVNVVHALLNAVIKRCRMQDAIRAAKFTNGRRLGVNQI